MTSENVHVKPEISVTVTKTECQNEILANWLGSAEMKFWQTGPREWHDTFLSDMPNKNFSGSVKIKLDHVGLIEIR